MDILDTTFLSPKQWEKNPVVYLLFLRRGVGGGGGV